MFQIAFGLGSDTWKAAWYNDIPRTLVSLPDLIIYYLIKYVYAIFFNIADASVIKTSTLLNFYNRIQLLLGVIMIFKLTISLLQVIINPELLTDQKQGFSKIISKIIIMLALFVSIIPLNIPENQAPEYSYNYYLNEHGLLFGTMYSLQRRVLINNTIAKLVLGNKKGSTFAGAAEPEQVDKEKKRLSAGDNLGSYILKTFISPNDECSSSEDYEKEYKKADTIYLFSNINTYCSADDDIYAYAYFPIISTICGAIVLICLIGFCIDIAIRAIKLAVLRLIAPIPIISYINPKSSENGAFANWIKMVISTYVDLFIRLAIIYFVLFLAKEITDKGIGISFVDPVISSFAVVFIIIGLFFFAGQAPKFFRDALGLKGMMGNVGLSGILGGAGALAVGGGLNDAINAGKRSAKAQSEAYNQGKQGPGLVQSLNVGRDMMAQELTGNDKMTYDQMKLGRGYLRHNNITQKGAEAQKNEMYKLKDKATMAHNKYKRFENGNMTNAELDDYARRYGHYDAHGGADGNGGYVLSDLERINVLKDLENDYLSKEADAGKAESKYKDMQTTLDKYGGSRNGYRAKHGNLRKPAQRDTRFSDFTTSEGRAAIRSGGVRAVASSVIDAPRNFVSDRRDEREAQRTSRLNARDSSINNYNDNLNQTRNHP